MVGKDRVNVNSWERKYSAVDEIPCAAYSGTGLRVERAACSIAVDPRVKGVLQKWYQSPGFHIVSINVAEIEFIKKLKIKLD